MKPSSPHLEFQKMYFLDLNGSLFTTVDRYKLVTLEG
jgi:hypothetical protein